MMKKITSCILVLSLLFSVLVFSNSIVMAEELNLEQSNLVQKDIVKLMEDDGFLEVDKTSNVVRITEKYKREVLVRAADEYEVTFTENSVTLISKNAASGGVTKIEFTTFGYNIYLDSTTANQVAAGVGGAAALSVLIPDPVACKIIAAALGVISSLIAYNNAGGTGVIISYFGGFPNGYFYWIAPQ